jgi:hypothetical protein
MTKRTPNTACENISAGKVRRGHTIRLKNFTPAWDDQAERPWDEKEFSRKSVDYLVTRTAIIHNSAGRRMTTSYQLHLAEVLSGDAQPYAPARSLTLSSSVRILLVP